MPRKILNDTFVPPEQRTAATTPLRETDLLNLHEDVGSGEFATRKTTPAALKEFIGAGAQSGTTSPEAALVGSVPDQYWRIVLSEAGVLTTLEFFLKTSGTKTNTGWTLVHKYV